MDTERLKIMDQAINAMHTSRTVTLQRISIESNGKTLVYDPKLGVMQAYDEESVWVPDATPAEQIIRDAREQ